MRYKNIFLIFLIGGILMARGNPDHLIPDSGVAVSSFDTSAIVGALGGVVSADGRGRVLYATDFGNGANDWSIAKTANAVFGLSKDYGVNYSSGLGFYITPNVAGDNAYMSRFFAGATGYRFGIEAGFYLTSFSGGVTINVDHYTDKGWYKIVLRITPDDKIVAIYGSDGLYKTIYTFILAAGIQPGWYAIKIVWDTNAKKYVRLLIGSRQFDLSQYSLPVSSTLPFDPVIQAQIKVTGYTGKVDRVGIGYIIYTNDEP